MTPQDAYEWLRQHSLETAHLTSIGRLLGWDQRTQIPPKGHSHRHNQFAMLAKWIHQRETDRRIAEMLPALAGSELVADPLSAAAVNLREWRRNYDRATKIPQDLAVALAQAAAEGETAWEQTRPASDWQTFRPYLERLVDLKRQETEALGYVQHPYDPLLDDYEPGETAAALAPLLGELRDALLRLLEAIQGSRRRPDRSILRRHFPQAGQERFARRAAEKIGYDLAAGRLDPTAHPFSTGIGPGDVRITTRYDENFFGMAFFGTLHETGHALYDQGLPAEHWGAPLGDSVSLGIHESQSRLWENLVGRSLGFWKFFYPEAQQTFPALAGVDLAAFHFAVNEVRPDLIRTEADEITYNLHILLRFELELSLIKGDLQVADLPGAWNDKMQAFLGLTPPNHSQGVMQDVHWSAGHLGYFPTYTLGNIYAAQFFARAEGDLGVQAENFAQGDFAPLLQWLREKIHHQGNRYRPRELVRVVAGEAPNPQYLVDYLWKKFGEFYDLRQPGL
jgi:carboxypeptidase Taq